MDACEGEDEDEEGSSSSIHLFFASGGGGGADGGGFETGAGATLVLTTAGPSARSVVNPISQHFVKEKSVCVCVCVWFLKWDGWMHACILLLLLLFLLLQEEEEEEAFQGCMCVVCREGTLVQTRLETNTARLLLHTFLLHVGYTFVLLCWLLSCTCTAHKERERESSSSSRRKRMQPRGRQNDPSEVITIIIGLSNHALFFFFFGVCILYTACRDTQNPSFSPPQNHRRR